MYRSSRRQYHYCAKCGKKMFIEAGRFVCSECVGTPGRYNHCAVCGVTWGEPSMDWVCFDDLAHPVH
jgi:NADH pyrophosphatase NudC (nudix superfamily)